MMTSSGVNDRVMEGGYMFLESSCRLMLETWRYGESTNTIKSLNSQLTAPVFGEELEEYSSTSQPLEMATFGE